MREPFEPELQRDLATLRQLLDRSTHVSGREDLTFRTRHGRWDSPSARRIRDKRSIPIAHTIGFAHVEGVVLDGTV